MTVQVITGPVIRGLQSLSEPLECSRGLIFRILMPPAWDRADLTFQLSQDGQTFYNVHDLFGQEVVLPVIPGSVVPLNDYLKEIHSLKFRSGRSAAPIIQSDERVFGLVIEVSEAQTAPVPVNGFMTSGETVVSLQFDMPLEAESVPVVSAFTVIVKGVNQPVMEVNIIDNAVHLTMNARYASGPIVCNYEPPSGAKLQGTNGIIVAAFTNFPISV